MKLTHNFVRRTKSISPNKINPLREPEIRIETSNMKMQKIKKALLYFFNKLSIVKTIIRPKNKGSVVKFLSILIF